jgi:acetyltransferase-like isoleucine patch superfamily enzyme
MNGNVQAIDLSVGIGTIISSSAVIRGVNGKAKKITIGDNCYIGDNVQIICDDFSIGDYSKIHHDVNIHGYKPCHIGHNAWIGQYTIIDSIGGTTIGDNCGIGAHSQLWSHIKYGDTLEGCRFLSEKNLVIGNDVWLVGHCIVSPITAADKSMALVGAVITTDMDYNSIYAGSPAKNISPKIGMQFNERTLFEKEEALKNYLITWNTNASDIKIVTTKDLVDFSDSNSYFVIADRKYKKVRSDNEIAFMRFLLPEKAKFVPY